MIQIPLTPEERGKVLELLQKEENGGGIIINHFQAMPHDVLQKILDEKHDIRYEIIRDHFGNDDVVRIFGNDGISYVDVKIS